jgi:DNA repair ATPase RecN
METDRYMEALDFLELEAIKGSEYELESIWYQALLYLKMEEIEKAEERLSKLSEMPSKYQEDASDLLRELRRIK